MQNKQEWKIGDCRDYLLEIPRIDLICTDPPFNFSTHGQGIMRKRDYLDKIQEGFGSDFNPLEYLDLFYELMEPFNAYFFCNKTLVPVYLKWAATKKLSWDILTWIKPNPTPLHNNHYLPDIEYIIFIKDAGAYWNKSLKFNYYRKWIIEDSPNQHKTTYDHPSAKPVNIIKKLLLVSCPQNGIVLDPFLGSGTTLQACEELSIKGYGFEINQDYEEVIKKRLNGATSLEKWADIEKGCVV